MRIGGAKESAYKLVARKELKMTTEVENFREVKITADEADQKNSGWHGPLKLEQMDNDTAYWIREALNDCGLDLLIGGKDVIGEVYVKVAPKPVLRTSVTARWQHAGEFTERLRSV